MATIELDATGPDWRLAVERRSGRLVVVENRAILRDKQYNPEVVRRDPEHRHDYGQNYKPVVGFDLHQTLTPDWGYPLLAPPFTGVKAALDILAGRGCCIHMDSASLDNPDPDFNTARTRQARSFVRNNGLPVSFIGPNVEASIRIDDRGVPVPKNPDWSKIADQIHQSLAGPSGAYTLTNGVYQRKSNLSPVGDLIDDWPDDGDVPQDSPRGLSTPLIDIDFHRTLMPAWGTKRDAPPDPVAVQVIRQLYDDGYSIQFSCGGWNWATLDNQQFAIDRPAWQRRYLRQWGIPYDRLVTKDDVDVWVDDKVVRFTGDWTAMDKLIRKRLGPPMPWASNSPINERNGPPR